MNPIRIFLSAALLLLPALAPAADIVALCIGNDAYHKPEDVLDTPVADARLMKQALEALPGGADVKLLTDASRVDIVIALNELKDRAKGAKLALVFYSGHGMDGQPRGYQNEDTFLLPVEAQIPTEDHLAASAVGLREVLAALKDCPVTARAVILDCCRTGAPKATGALVAGGTKNFGQLDERVKVALGKAVVPEATLVAFAASPGRKAAAFLSEQDANSPFTRFLAEQLGSGAGNLRDLVEAAAEQTELATERRQVPYVSYSGATSAIRQIVFRGTAEVVVTPPGNSPEMAALRTQLQAAEKAREEAERMAALAASTSPSPLTSIPESSTPATMTRLAPTVSNGGFPEGSELPGNPPQSDLPEYDYWEKETVRAFEKLLVQQNGAIVPLCSKENLPQLMSLDSFKTKDGRVHSISCSELFLDLLFRGEVAKDLPMFVVGDSGVVRQIGVSPKAKSDRYSYNEIAVGRAKLAELRVRHSEKQAQYESSKNDPQFALDRVESMILELGINISSFEYIVGQFSFAWQGDLLVNANLLTPELNELAKQLDILEMLETMPEMTIDQLVASIRQQPGESEDDRMFSGALRLFYFYTNSARGVNLFPSSPKDEDVWASAGDLLLAGLESKELRPWVRDQLGVLQSVVRALDSDEAAFRDALNIFVANQSEFAKTHKGPKLETSPSVTSSNSLGLIYETPDGWTEGASIPMQDVSFTFGEGSEGKCFLARVPKAEGGLALIVNRWRSKMGGSPLSSAEVEALPVCKIFGQEARKVIVDGDYTSGEVGAEKLEDHRLVGVVLASEAGAIMVEMTGPKELIEQNESAFDLFVSSLDIDSK